MTPEHDPVGNALWFIGQELKRFNDREEAKVQTTPATALDARIRSITGGIPSHPPLATRPER